MSTHNSTAATTNTTNNESSYSKQNHNMEACIQQLFAYTEKFTNQMFPALYPSQTHIEEMTNELLSSCNKLLTNSIVPLSKSMTSIITESLCIQDFISAFNFHLKVSLDSLSETPSDNYVEIDSDIADKMEKRIVEIPQDLYIRTNSKTIRIRTDFFINIVSLIISVIFGIISTVQSADDTLSVDVTAQELQYLEAQTALLSEILENISTSDEESAEILRNLQQSVDTGNTLSQESLKVLDSIGESLDNSSELDCIPECTESE